MTDEAVKPDDNEEREGLVNLGSLVPMLDKIVDDASTIPPEVVNFMEAQSYERDFWNGIFAIETPPSQRHYRKGPYNKETGEHVMLEYVKDSYTIRMLNLLFPGWSNDTMKIQYVPDIQTFLVDGYIVIRYPMIDGVKIRKVWAVGACTVHAKSDSPNKASGADDMAKGAYTEWIKLVGKRLGIGVDVYEQSIPKTAWDELYDRISTYPSNALVLDIVKNINDRTTFFTYTSSLPTKKQGSEFAEVLKLCPANLVEKLKMSFQQNVDSTADEFISRIKNHIKKEGDVNGTN